MKLVLLDKDTLGELKDIELLNEFGTVTSYAYTAPEETIKRIGDAEIVLTNKVVIDQHVIDSCPNIKLICVLATGTNNIDIPYAESKGISVKNVAGYSTNSVAQHTFAMLFNLLHQLNFYDSYVKTGKYTESEIFTNLSHSFEELNGKEFGIVGLGAIGKKVADIAQAFGANVFYYSTSGKNHDNDYVSVDLKTLLTEADFVSIHAPLNEKTTYLFGENEFELMKRDAILLNLGRGKIVDEAALANALNHNKIKAAALDVLENEPINRDNPLLSLKEPQKILITPHIAWASMEARKKLIRLTVKNIKSFLE